MMNVRPERAGEAEECCLLTLSEAKGGGKGGHANSIAQSAVHTRFILPLAARVKRAWSGRRRFGDR
jgi:hypothetical protein